MKIKKLCALLTSAACCAMLLPVLPAASPAGNAYAADTVVIDTTTEHQTIRGFGGINLPEWITQGDMTDAQVQKAFGNGEDELGLTILRIYVSDDSNAWKNAVPTAQRAQKLGATIFATPWNPPASMRINGDGSLTGGKYQLDKSKWAEYAAHLNSYVKYMEGQGINLYSVSVQNEPDYAEDWTYWSADDLTSFIAQYGKAVTQGTNAKLMSPESFQYVKTIYNSILGNAQAYANTDLFGTHFYGTQRSQMDFPALENSGKEIWMTEVYVPNSSSDADTYPEALDVSENIHNGLVVGNLNAYVWWYIRRSYGLLKENGNISKRGYCMAQYSKFVRPGDVRIDATEQPASNVLVSAYKNDNDQVTIVAVNKSSEGYSQNFTLGSGESITNVDRYRTSANENIAKTEGLEYSGSGFWAQLPAQSVSTFVVSLEGEGKSPAEVTDEDGYYFHDTFEDGTDSWNGRGAATVTQSGKNPYAGSEALLVQDRSASWNGASKSLNTKTFVPGNEYSFSVNARYNEGETTEEFKLTLQYTGSDGEPHYANIATASVSAGQWVQLANANYKIPEDASDLVIYVETSDTTTSFYIDEAIGAPAGTEITGAVPVKLIPGDINCDGRVDAFDFVEMRKGLAGGFAGAINKQAADVDGSGDVEIADAVQLQSYILGKIKSFTQAEKPANEWDNYVETASSDYIKFYSDSIYQMGNTSRLRSKIEAGEKGEAVTVAYLGGSITEGKKYTDPFSSYFKSEFAKNAKFINAGLSGTSSVVGIMRAQRDILDAQPDIIFLEFSVNDHPEEIYKKSFESLVKKCLSQENDPAVIIIINRARGGYSMQEQMAAVGKNYNVPVISMDNALTNAFNSGLLTTDDYYTDEYHPHDKGGQLIADCLGYYFRQAMRSENASGSYTIPASAVYGTEYETASIVPVSELNNFSAGSFTADNSNTRFAYGYTFQKYSANTPMTFTTTGKGIFIVFKSNQNSSLGNLNVTVNGKSSSISGNRNYAWGGADADIAYIQNTSGQLEVSVSMEDASTDFTIWGIGVVK
ncbi:MAG: carbohydrate binding domain-containing protein [Ruminococcus sp.]|nr:carbohydrate binding domain-containing protein [Ruminococcus sp.]